MHQPTRGRTRSRKPRNDHTNARARAVRASGSIICAGLLLVACATSGSSAPSPHTPAPASAVEMSKSTFVTRASALCTANNDQLGNAAHKAFGNQRPTTQTWRPFMLDVALPIVETRLRGLDALPAPADDRAKLSAITHAGRAAITAAKHSPQLLTPASRAPFDHYDQLVAAFGIPACSVGG